MANVSEELLDLKKQIEDAKENKNMSEAKLEVLKKEMKDKFKISTTKAADKKINGWNDDLDELNEQLEEGIRKLREILG